MALVECTDTWLSRRTGEWCCYFLTRAVEHVDVISLVVERYVDVPWELYGLSYTAVWRKHFGFAVQRAVQRYTQLVCQGVLDVQAQVKVRDLRIRRDSEDIDWERVYGCIGILNLHSWLLADVERIAICRLIRHATLYRDVLRTPDHRTYFVYNDYWYHTVVYVSCCVTYAQVNYQLY